jgi:hypothetical protein
VSCSEVWQLPSTTMHRSTRCQKLVRGELLVLRNTARSYQEKPRGGTAPLSAPFVPQRYARIIRSVIIAHLGNPPRT